MEEPTPVPATFLTIDGSIGIAEYNTLQNTYFWVGFPLSSSCEIKISNKGTPVTDAVVDINSTGLAYTGNDSGYGIYDATYFAAAEYTVTVNYNGLTFTAVTPGNDSASLSFDTYTLSWTAAGGTRSLNVFQGSTNNYSISNFTPSPFIIPTAIAYPDTPGVYQVVCILNNGADFTPSVNLESGRVSTWKSYYWNFSK